MKKPAVSSKTGTESQLIAYASNVVKKSQENASLFPDAAEKVTLLESALADYMEARTEASFRDMRQVVIKNQQPAMVRQALYDLSLPVESVAKGAPDVLLAAGLIPPKKHASRRGEATN